MPEIMNIYIGRDNVEVFELQQDALVVAEDAVTRAVLRFGGYCLDSDSDEEIELTTSAQRVEIQAGLMTGLVAGVYPGMLTIFDAASETNGLAWQAFNVRVREWDVCPVVP